MIEVQPGLVIYKAHVAVAELTQRDPPILRVTMSCGRVIEVTRPSVDLLGDLDLPGWWAQDESLYLLPTTMSTFGQSA